MIINDNGREYDTEKIEEYSSYTQRLIKRLIYVRYVGIRDLLSDNCCSKYRVSQVREALTNENNIERIKNVFGYDVEEINYYIDFAEQFIPMVR
ncbi:hypothetical protein ABE905_06735 [Enterococcus durans]|uniref:hypothetical protein n=1 Tax=Enterococcus durans TaxID=53345 RepID=UPI003D6B4A9D